MAEETILIIEDDPEIALMMDDIMRERGYCPVITHDGLSGLELALQERPDLILLDLRLPQMSGVQLLSRLKQHQLNIPVVVVTAVGSEELALHALRMGVKDYVKKPFSLSELMLVIERALQEERLRRERDSLTAQLMSANRQLKRQMRQIESLYEVGQALTSALDLDERLNVILSMACHVLDVDLAAVFLLDERSGDLEFRLGSWDTADRLIGQRLQRGQGVAGWVAEHGEPLLVHDIRQDSRFSPVLDQMTGLNTQSILCVPLTAKGHVIGVVQAFNKKTGFTEDDATILHTLATSAAVAVENARNYENLRTARDQVAERSTEMKALLKKMVRLQRMTASLGTLTIGAGLYDVCKRLTEYAATLLDVKCATILLFDPECQTLVCQEPTFGIASDILRDSRISLKQDGPIWDVWQNGKSLMINDLTQSPWLRALGLSEAVTQGIVHSIMVSPMHIGGRSIGLFQVFDKLNGGQFTPDDQRILEVFAIQSTIAMENARLIVSQQRSASEV